MKPLALCLAFAALPALMVGCNTVLGNEHGDPLDGAPPDTLFDAGRPVDGVGPSDATVAVDAAVDAADGGQCTPAEKLCFGKCVSSTDPLYGCDVDGCVPCKTGRATSICGGGRCAIGACDPGYADCNQKGADGCETDLSQATHCGTCNAICQAGAPYCAPAGASFACSTNCPAQAPTLCGAQCVDLDTSESHCGDCNTPCPAVANGQETCVARVCQLSCDASFHKCGNSCVSSGDPATCGGSCTPCTAPPNGIATCNVGGVCGWVCRSGFHACAGSCVSNNNVASCGATSCTACPSTNATPTCNGTTCGFTCAATFGDCDGNPANACETSLDANPNNCGKCGLPCGGNPCIAGKCQVPDAGPPDTGPPDTGSD